MVSRDWAEGEQGVIANRYRVCVWRVLALVAITKYYGMGGLHNRNL